MALLWISAVLEICAQQSGTSVTLGGRVEDTAGGVLAGVTVAASHRERNQRFQSETDSAGRYVFLRLPPGPYVVSVRDARFEPYERVLTLTVGQAVDLPISLPVAGRRDSVVVEASGLMLDADRTQVADTVTQAAVNALPLNGRNYLDVALLAPGVSRTNTGVPQQFAETSAVPGTGISASGQRNLNNSLLVDGIPANDDAAGLPGTFFSQEVIREFQVITAGANAEFGRASSAVLNVATKSGTNDWHGRAYAFLRNQRLDARSALATGKDPLTQTQYGLTGGGPLSRDRSFLFSNFEQTRRNAAGYVTIAPANVRAINAALDSFGYRGPRLTWGEFPTGWDFTNYFGRVDHRIGEADSLFIRYNLYDVAGDNVRSAGGLNAISRGTRLDNRDQSLGAAFLRAHSPRSMNEVRLLVARGRLSAAANDRVGPAVSVAGRANFGASTTSPEARDLDSYELADSFSAQHGRHFVRAGADFLLNRLNIFFPGSQRAAVYSFSSVAALQAGRYITFQQAFGDPYQFQSNPNLGAFFQDDWKAMPDLALSFGLRYDLQGLPAPIRTDANNLAPRLGIAWSPGDRRTAVRASYGIHYDRVPLRAVSNALQRDGSKYRVALLAFGEPGAPAFPQQLSWFPTGQYINVTTIDRSIQNSYSHQAGFQIERQVGRGTFLSLGYEWLRALHLIVSRNLNVPSAPAASGIPNLGRPDPRYGNINQYEGSGDAYYHGLLASFRTTLLRRAEVRVAYTLSKAIDTAGNFFFSSPQNSMNLRDDRGLSDNDQRHRLTAAAIVRLPGGWELSPLFRYTSALPFNVQAGYDRNQDTNLNDRPAGVGRNTGRGFNFAALDVRLKREFRLTERVRVDALGEAFNALNRVNRALPNNVLGPGFGGATAVYDPRQIQAALRVNY
jgi:hypothetical protein